MDSTCDPINYYRKGKKRIYRNKSTFLKSQHTKQNCISTSLFNCKFSPSDDYECEKCHFTTHNKVIMQNHHKEMCHVSNPVIRSYNCENCDFQTYSMIILLKHLTEVTEAKHFDQMDWFECDHCVFRSKSKDSLKRHHLSKHAHSENIEWFKCDYKTKTRYNLKNYSLKHTIVSELWFQCQHCAYQCKNSVQLKKHVSKIHGKNTIQKDIGSGENVWYKCEHCAYQTNRKGLLNRHVSVTHENDEQVTWYKCDQCGYQAKRKDYLKNHLSRHERENNINIRRWFRCKYCLFKSIHECYLKSHMLAKHDLKMLSD